MDLLVSLAETVRSVAEEVVRPRWRRLEHHEVSHKQAGEMVTVADGEAEALLNKRLPELLDVPVLGEEASAADPGLLQRRAAEDRLWIVDPVDGTVNFAAGSPDYAVMVALVERGRPTLACIFQPEHERMYLAERGAGATVDGRPIDPSLQAARRPFRGDWLVRFMDGDTRTAVEAAGQAALARGQLMTSGSAACSGIDYPRIATGELDFLLWWRTRPWDHLAGSLLVEEAGGAALRPDGSPYRPFDGGEGLLVAHRAADWPQIRNVLGLPGGGTT
jgi:fructose-1,6-bisphosphatase/inositol monophosphatase family enzyme